MEAAAVGDGAPGAGDAAASAPAGRSQQGAKRGRGGAVRGSEADAATAAWGQPPPPALLPPPQGPGAGSRIYRVRASGGKDRHSKVYTAKGIRDRRVRLSVPTAIQFYDLQDRLGFDQPSKAIEWLINAASSAIEKLPELDPAAFAALPAPGDADAGGKDKQQQQQQGSKSGGSSTPETSKGSELSLSRSDGRGGTASRDREVTVASTSAQAASFTELLTGVASASSITAAEHKQSWHQQPNVSAAAADCVGIAHHGKGAHGLSAHSFSAPTAAKFGNAPPFGLVPAQPFNFTSPIEMPHFSLGQDTLAASSAAAGDYSLNFSMSSGFLGANRGTLQSNSQSNFSGHHHQQLQRLDGPILFGHAHAAAAAHPASENQLTASAALQLWDGLRHSGMKEKSKN
ncbi:unnamed protein product [Miscanthus lutarioriparius]|uniref:TCP domain-containing protein n=1 Tax=Miscanthus lutarioriparius TaxID=422564 RepID=A0A811MHQ4_9POAL|nr:unnamed protein product [Miscanthus lutarioriparius]